ncbi:sulfite exporter TauE/SafE family protein [Marinagarivorans algicola]|uniref:sulfite exporter TauE/SafE family protein n=1 Tax=Marinagarivorans algicola TaxID=1513270 RepID=UPI0006B57BD0
MWGDRLDISFLVEQCILLLVAFVANVLSSLAGGGAGLLQLPALIFLGLPFAVALTTHKIASVALGLGASIQHGKTGHIHWGFAIFILAAGLPGVVLGAYWVLAIPELIAQVLLGVLTLALGVYSIVKPALGVTAIARHRNGLGLVIGGSVLFLIGVLNGSLTSGTGLFVTLWLIRWFGFDYKHALAYTMILVGFFWNGAGALTLVWVQTPQWSWLPVLLLGSLLGGYFGAYWAIAKGNHFIKRIFEGLTIVVGVSLLVEAWIY